MEFYVLVENTEILGVFTTFEECLTWKPFRELYDPLWIYRVRKKETEFKIQKILVMAKNFNRNE